MEWWEYAITQGYGPTSEPLDGPYAGYAHFNKGLDYGVPMGTPIRSVITGTVVAAGPGSDGWGTRVQIQDPQGNIHNFGHLSLANVQVGQQVYRGEVLGASGNTGASTGPHLSYDVWNYDPVTGAANYINPSSFITGLPGAAQVPEPEDDFLVTPPAGAGAPQTGPADSGGLPSGAIDLGNGTAVVSNPVTGGVIYYTKDPYSGEWQQGPGLTQPYGGPPTIKTDSTGQAYEWNSASKSWERSPQWDDPTKAQGSTTLREMVNPATGQKQLAVVDTKTGKVVQWGDSAQSPADTKPGYFTIPAAASPAAGAQNSLFPDNPQAAQAPNRADALSVANAITGGGGGQFFTQFGKDGSVTNAQASLASDLSRNQMGNNHMILQAYGVDTSKADFADPIKAAATAQYLHARQQALLDNGFSPTEAQSVIMMENAGGGNASMQLPITTPLYNPGQGIVQGNAMDGTGQNMTYSAEYARQYGLT